MASIIGVFQEISITLKVGNLRGSSYTSKRKGQSADLFPMNVSIEEELLTARAAGGDKNSAKVLLDRHTAWTYALAFRISQNKALAHQATVEALAKSLKDLKQPEQKRNFRFITMRHLIDHLGSQLKKKSASAPLSFAEELNLIADIPRERKALLGMIVAGLKALPFEDRTVLLLRDQGHMSCEAIGELVNQSPVAIHKRLSEIRLRLRHSLSAPLSGIKSS